MARAKKKTDDKQPASNNGNGANLGFEAQLFLAADKLRKNLKSWDPPQVTGNPGPRLTSIKTVVTR